MDPDEQHAAHVQGAIDSALAALTFLESHTFGDGFLAKQVIDKYAISELLSGSLTVNTVLLSLVTHYMEADSDSPPVTDENGGIEVDPEAVKKSIEKIRQMILLSSFS